MSEEIHDLAEAADVNPLIPNGIENLQLRCVICTMPVPMRRARGRSKDTCSQDCHSVLRKFRKFCINSTVCPACYHPSTPQERVDFIQWRKDRKYLRRRAGRPRKGQDFVTAARRALEFIASFKGHDSVISECINIATNDENGNQISILGLVETALKAPIDTQGFA